MSGEASLQRLTRARLRQLMQLKSARARREQGLFLIDGERLVAEAVDCGAPIIELLSTAPERWRGASAPLTQLSRADAERLSDTRTPQGHFALVRDVLRPVAPPASERWQAAALDGVQDTGNVGGIIRSAAAFEVESVIVGPGTADPTHPRVTRAATGAWFQVGIARSTDLAADVTLLRRSGAAVLVADRTGDALHAVEIPAKVVWLFGNEGAGVSAALEPLIDGRVAVPIAAGVDSLNVNVAAGIILHDGYRRTLEGSG